mmetsp:Transcript_26776/g.82813  ORF Transcript_26776/g.82813 Transcript_26776/m.82813 type:complete len:201 (+) Transcript_26776:316-918(+)
MHCPVTMFKSMSSKHVTSARATRNATVAAFPARCVTFHMQTMMPLFSTLWMLPPASLTSAVVVASTELNHTSAPAGSAMTSRLGCSGTTLSKVQRVLHTVESRRTECSHGRQETGAAVFLLSAPPRKVLFAAASAAARVGFAAADAVAALPSLPRCCTSCCPPVLLRAAPSTAWPSSTKVPKRVCGRNGRTSHTTRDAAV